MKRKLYPSEIIEHKPKGPGYEHITSRITTICNELIDDFKAGKQVNWPVLKPFFVHQVWEDFIKKGYVSDETKLDTIFASMRDNVVRLIITSSVSQYSKLPVDLLDDCLEKLSTPEVHAFFEWLTGSNHDKNISDYGTQPLIDALAFAFEAKKYEEKLKYLDGALHITHARGDLSCFFIEGGRGNELQLEKPRKLKM